MDKELFMSEVKDWLVQTGTVRELQTKLRSDLIKAITAQAGEGHSKARSLKIRPQELAKKPDDPGQCALNLMVIEHLMTRKCWYSCSVMANEADFGPKMAPPNIEEVAVHQAATSSHKDNKPTKSQHPVKLSIQEVQQVLELLSGFPEPAALAEAGFTFGRKPYHRPFAIPYFHFWHS